MAAARPAAGGGHWVDVPPERLAGWLDRFDERHGPGRSGPADGCWQVEAADGATAELHAPFGPLPASVTDVGALVAEATRDRPVGVLLVRLGGHAAGVFHGSRLVASKVGSRHVQGRSAAGGWSQQRFARRREGQGRVALEAAANVAAAVLGPVAGSLDAVVTGGDRRSVGLVLDDPRLAALRALVVDTHLDVPDPRLKVLAATPHRFRCVRVRVVETDRAPPAR